MTNATFFLNAVIRHPIGCIGVKLPEYLRHNKTVITLEKDSRGRPYTDNPCHFRCMALHRGSDVTALTASTTLKLYTD